MGYALGPSRCDGEVNAKGWVTERSIVHAWKACVPKRYRGFESPPIRGDRAGAARSKFEFRSKFDGEIKLTLPVLWPPFRRVPPMTLNA